MHADGVSQPGGLSVHTTIRGLIDGKPHRVHTTSAGEPVLRAARLMNEHRIGALVVVENESVVGILTERDVMTRVVAAERDPNATSVAEVMTERVLTCTPDTPIGEARQVMRRERIRHLPVIEGTRLVGMVSIGDLNLVENETLSETIRYMEAYIGGGQL